MRTFYLLIAVLSMHIVQGQEIAQKLEKALTLLEKDEQFEHALIGFCVNDASNGKLVFEKNGQLGLAPASCQKIVTSAAAFELLGKDYHYITRIGFDGAVNAGIQKGNLVMEGFGDPTLGSWRWNNTKEAVVLNRILKMMKRQKVTGLTGGIVINDLNFSYQPVPDGWVWQDIGNYYGAGAWGVNWRENQFDLNVASGQSVGAATSIVSTNPVDIRANVTNLIVTAKKGSGDQGYIYSSPYNDKIFATGTIPAGETKFTLTGSLPNPPAQFAREIARVFKTNGLSYEQGFKTASACLSSGERMPELFETLDSIVSPSLDSINYWFLKKSVNLYGEAFVKTISFEKNRVGSTDDGIEIIRTFFSKTGIDKSSLKIIDGSGLAPGNRVTTAALVKVLQFARKQSWYASFYNALPEMNGIKMKDGYIGGVRSYSGYVKSAAGKEYIFSFIVNNFDGSPSTAREKIWKVLDLLK